MQRLFFYIFAFVLLLGCQQGGELDLTALGEKARSGDAAACRQMVELLGMEENSVSEKVYPVVVEIGQPMVAPLLDAVGTGIGFTIALVMMGGFREILGTGSFLEYSLFGPNFEPWVIMVLPAGGFLTLGFILLAMGFAEQRKKAKTSRTAEASS